MSYRAPEQDLEEPIDDIINGIDKFDKAVDKRVESNEWQQEHLVEISELSLQLRRIKFSLVKLKHETW